MGLLELVLVIVLILALVGSIPGGPVAGWGGGYAPFGLILVVLLIFVLLRAV